LTEEKKFSLIIPMKKPYKNFAFFLLAGVAFALLLAV
jgi:hypothetical protein